MDLSLLVAPRLQVDLPVALAPVDRPSLQPQEIARLSRQFRDDSAALQRLWCLERDIITGFRGYMGQQSLARAGMEMAYFNRPRDISFNITQPQFRNASAQLETAIPSWGCRPASNDVADLAKAQADAAMLGYHYVQGEVKSKLSEAVDWSIIFGTSALLTSTKGQDDAINVVEDAFGPDRIRAEPGIDNPDKSRFLAVTRITTKADLTARFPDKAEAIAQAPRPSAQTSWWDSPGLLPPDRVEVLEAYCRSGHWFLLVGEAGIVLASGITPGRCMPIQILRYTPLPFEFFGMGLVEQAMPGQYAYSASWNQILTNARYTSNPKILVPKLSGLAPDAFNTSQAGEKIFYNLGNKPEQWQGQPLPQYVQQLPASAQSAVADSTGIHQSSQGKRTPGLATGAAINAITANDQVQFGITKRDIKRVVEHLGRNALLYIKEYYPPSKYVRQFGGRYGSPIATLVRASDLSENPDVFIEADTLFEGDVQARQERVMELARLQIIPPDQVLKMLQNNEDPLRPQQPIADYVDAKKALEAVVQVGFETPMPTPPGVALPPGTPPLMRPTVKFYASDNLDAYGEVARQYIRSDEFNALDEQRQDDVDRYYQSILELQAPPMPSNDPSAQGAMGQLANPKKAPQAPGLPAGATPGDATGNMGSAANGPTTAEQQVNRMEGAAEGADQFSR